MFQRPQLLNLQDRVNNQLQYRGSMKLQIQNEFLAELETISGDASGVSTKS